MDIYSGHINKLIEQLSRLPGVGAKSAQRLAFHIINMPQEEVEKLTRTMLDAKANIRYCKECFTLTDKDLSYQGAPLRGSYWVQRCFNDNKEQLLSSTAQFISTEAER